jgi:hypothetical protein
MSDGNVTLAGKSASAPQGEVWNNPVEEATIHSWQVEIFADADEGSLQGLIELAWSEGFPSHSAKRVNLKANYSLPSDSGEINADADLSAYVVLDAGGKVVAAYLIDDPRLATLGLPEIASDSIGPSDILRQVLGRSVDGIVDEALQKMPNGGTVVLSCEPSQELAPPKDEYLQAK